MSMPTTLFWIEDVIQTYASRKPATDASLEDYREFVLFMHAYLLGCRICFRSLQERADRSPDCESCGQPKKQQEVTVVQKQ